MGGGRLSRPQRVGGSAAPRCGGRKHLWHLCAARVRAPNRGLVESAPGRPHQASPTPLIFGVRDRRALRAPCSAAPHVVDTTQNICAEGWSEGSDLCLSTKQALACAQAQYMLWWACAASWRVAAWRLVVLRTTLRYLFGCGFAAPPPSKNLPNGKPGTQRVTSRASDLAGR